MADLRGLQYLDRTQEEIMVLRAIISAIEQADFAGERCVDHRQMTDVIAASK